MTLDDVREDGGAESAETIETLFPEGSIRLAEISVYNWGTFNGLHTGRIDPEGTLISGHTGAGKSTFADALQPLLLRPMDAKFNVAAAQGEGRDRSLFTYVRGRLGSVEDSNGRASGKYKRSKEALSGLRALYRTDAGNEFTIAALFWLKADGTGIGDIDRAYVVARRNVPLKELLDAIRGKERDGVRFDHLSNRYKGHSEFFCTRNFEAYAVQYKKALYLEDDKAPALLARAMGLKRIDDLTSLVRELVLEEPEIRDKVDKALTEFRSLSDIHAALVEARGRHDTLQSLPSLVQERLNQLEERNRLQMLWNVYPAWHAAQVVTLLDRVIGDTDREISECEQRAGDAQQAIEQRQGALNDAIQIYHAAGGDDLERLKKEEDNARKDMEEAARNVAQMNRALQKVDLKAPDGGWSDAALADLKRRIRKHIEESGQSIEAQNQEYGNALAERHQVDQRLLEIRAELDELAKRPNSSIDGKYLRLRAFLAEQTGIPIEDMPFLGELIAVRDAEMRWRPAIEHALGFLRLRFAISEQHRQTFREFLDTHRTGLRVGFDIVHSVAGETPFKPDSFLRKLEWGKHPFREWAKRHLVAHTLDCVESREAMNDRPYSMTVTGLIQRKLGSYDKDDREDIQNPGLWYTGFSNEGRKNVLQKELHALTLQRNSLTLHVKTVEDQIDARRTFSGQTEMILQLTWADIDVEGFRRRARDFAEAIAQRLASKVDLAAAKQTMLACQGALKAAQDAHLTIVQELAAAKERQRQHVDRRAREAGRAATILDEALPEALAARFDLLTIENLPSADDIERSRVQLLNSELSKAGIALTGTEREIEAIQTRYKERYPGPAADLPSRMGRDTDASALSLQLQDWVRHFTDLTTGKLPELVTRYTDSLNRQATHSLVSIDQAIHSQADEIRERIDQINTVLERTEIKNGSRLSIVATPLVLETVKAFEEQMRNALRMAAGNDREAHFEALKIINATLARATDPATRHNLESKSQLDARYRTSFAVHEWKPPEGQGPDCAVADRVTVDFHRNTQGKSGGEKEGFSGLVVASALAYVLTPPGARKPTYCSVILDEAFSNTSDDLARRVLKVFKELGLHLNLITPFKNVELARTAVRSALIVDIDARSESRLSEVTWEEIDDQRRAATDPLIRAAAERLEVKFEVVQPPAA